MKPQSTLRPQRNNNTKTKKAMDPSKSVQSLPELRSAAVERAAFGSVGKSLSTPTIRKTVVVTSTFCNGGSTPNTNSIMDGMERCNNKQTRETGAWKVENLGALPSLPSTSFRLFIGRSSLATTVPVSVVLTRIETFLRLESIASTIHYDTVQIDCVTFHQLHFSIHMWQGFVPEDDQIVIEVRRLQGCSVEMQRTRQALFQYITTGTREESEGEQNHCQQHFNAAKNRCTLSHLKPICAIVKKLCSSGNNASLVAMMNSKQQSCKQGMTKCEDLLGNHHDDQKRLGMESLVNLTNPAAASTDTADTVTRAIVFGTSSCAERIREDLMYYIRSASSGGSESTLLMSDENDFEIFEYDERHNTAVMRTLALRVLANSLEREEKRMHRSDDTSNNDDDDDKTPLFQSTYWWEMLDSLLFILQDASLHPHDAAAAAKCIRLLDEISVASSTTKLSTHFSVSFLKHLIAAHAYGEAHHLNLEIESQRLMDRVSDCI